MPDVLAAAGPLSGQSWLVSTPRVCTNNTMSRCEGEQELLEASGTSQLHKVNSDTYF